MSLRRLAAAALLAVTVSAAGAAGATAAPLPLPKPEGGHFGPSAGQHPNSLRITVSDSGRALDSRTYRLECDPAGGSHPDPRSACAQLNRATVWGQDPFAETRKDGPCTQISGGPATARIEGTWHGRPVKAEFDRSNGCEIERWNKFAEVFGTA